MASKSRSRGGKTSDGLLSGTLAGNRSVGGADAPAIHTKQPELDELEVLLKDEKIEEIDFINPYEDGGVIWEEWTKEKFQKALHQASKRDYKQALYDISREMSYWHVDLKDVCAMLLKKRR